METLRQLWLRQRPNETSRSSAHRTH